MAASWEREPPKEKGETAALIVTSLLNAFMSGASASSSSSVVEDQQEKGGVLVPYSSGKASLSNYLGTVLALSDKMKEHLTPPDGVEDYPIRDDEWFPNFDVAHPKLDFFVNHLKSNSITTTKPITLKIHNTCGAKLPEDLASIYQYFWEIKEDVKSREGTDYTFYVNFVIVDTTSYVKARYNRYCEVADEEFVRSVINSMLHQGVLDDHGWISS